MANVKQPVIPILIFTWVGFVSAISFMEAWLKFTAPGVTVPIGLGIGRIVFGALNKVEWVLAATIILTGFTNRYSFHKATNLLFAIPVLILAIQTFWLLPALDVRALDTIQGLPTEPSGLHYYYVGMEVIKWICLISFGMIQFKKQK